MKYYVYAKSFLYEIFREYDSEEELINGLNIWLETDAFNRNQITVVKGEELDLKKLLKGKND